MVPTRAFVRLQSCLPSGKGKYRKCNVEVEFQQTVGNKGRVRLDQGDCREQYTNFTFTKRNGPILLYEDEELIIMKGCVRSWNWNQCMVPSNLHVKHDLCVYGDLFLRGTRIVIPKILRDRVIKIAHEGH